MIFHSKESHHFISDGVFQIWYRSDEKEVGETILAQLRELKITQLDEWCKWQGSGKIMPKDFLLNRVFLVESMNIDKYFGE